MTRAGRRRARRVALVGVPMFVSIAAHVACLVGAGLVVWRFTRHDADEGRPVTIEFFEPGSGAQVAAAEPPKQASDAPAESVPVAIGADRPTASSAPTITGLTTPPSGRDEGVPVRGGYAPEAEGIATNAAGSGGVRFAGLGSSTARSVVYVIDASGPMVTSLERVLDAVKRSVARLGPTQKFNVVLSRCIGDSGGVTYFNAGLVRATPEAKGALETWLASPEPAGRSCPLEGLKAALELQPEAVFLLSRGIERSGGGVWGLGLDETMRELERLNPTVNGKRRTVIKTIQFLSEDPTGIMQAIGSAHGGTGDSYIVIRAEGELGG